MRKIAIIGSGIAGLVLGNFLREFNLNFKIIETKKEINPHEGYGIQLSTNSIKILNKIGFNKFDKDKFFNPKKVCFKSLNNQKLISEIDINTFNNENELYTCLRRPSLLKFLSKDLSEFIEFDKYVTNLEHSENKIKINFRDGSSENFDFLVIATGMDSNAKKFVCENSTNPHYSDSIAIRATFKDDLKIIDKENISLFLGNNAHLVTYPINKNQDLNAVLITKLQVEKDPYYKWRYSEEEQKLISSTLNEKLYIHNKDFKYVFEKRFNWWPINIDKNFAHPKFKNVFVIGDALFSNLPTLAQGAAQAIESAFEVSNYFRAADYFDLQSYYRRRIKRLNLIDRRTRINYFIFHLSNPFLILIRNIFLKFFSKNKFFLNQYLGKVYKTNW